VVSIESCTLRLPHIGTGIGFVSPDRELDVNVRGK